MSVGSKSSKPVDLCWEKHNKKKIKLDFSVKRNMEHSTEAADADTLNSLTDDLKLVEEELEGISRNI